MLEVENGLFPFYSIFANVHWSPNKFKCGSRQRCRDARGCVVEYYTQISFGYILPNAESCELVFEITMIFNQYCYELHLRDISNFNDKNLLLMFEYPYSYNMSKDDNKKVVNKIGSHLTQKIKELGK